MIKSSGKFLTIGFIALTIWVGIDLSLRGAPAFSLTYFVEPPADLGRGGGIGPVLVTTVIIVGMAVLLASFVSLVTAILVVEFELPVALREPILAVLDIGVGVPRVVWGLGGGFLFCGVFGLGFSVTSGVLTLACLLAPIVTTGFVSGLRGVDPALRRQAQSLGVPRLKALLKLILPAARPSLATSIALASSRACGDAAALLFTSGVFAPTLAVHVHHLVTAVPGGLTAAYAAATMLFFLSASIQIGISLFNRINRD